MSKLVNDLNFVVCAIRPFVTVLNYHACSEDQKQCVSGCHVNATCRIPIRCQRVDYRVVMDLVRRSSAMTWIQRTRSTRTVVVVVVQWSFSATVIECCWKIMLTCRTRSLFVAPCTCEYEQQPAYGHKVDAAHWLRMDVHPSEDSGSISAAFFAPVVRD